MSSNMELIMAYFFSRRAPVAELLLLLVAMAWGTSYGVTKLTLDYTTVFAFLFIRFALTSILLLPLCLYRHYLGKTGEWYYAVPIGIVLFVIFCAETYGVLHTSAANAAFLISLCIIVTPFVEWLVLKQRPKKGLLFYIGVSLVGVFLLTQPEHGELTINHGDVSILIAAILRALLVVLTKKITEQKSLSAIEITTVQSTVVMLCSLLLVCIQAEWRYILPSGSFFWLNTLYLVLFCTIFAFFIQNYAIKKSSPTRVSLLMGSEPAFGAIFAVLFLGESFTALQGVGAGLILASTLCVSANISLGKKRSRIVVNS